MSNKYYWNVRYLELEGSFSEAISFYRQAIDRHSGFSWHYYHLAEALAQMGKFDEALSNYRQAINLKPNSALMYSGLGAVLIKKGQLNEATKALQQAIQINSNLPWARFFLATALKQQNHLNEAIAEYQQAIKLYPNCQFWNDLGCVFLLQNKLDDAVFAFKSSIELKPEYSWAYHHLGGTLQNQAKIDEAIACYNRAIELNPNFFASHINLGELLEGQGKLKEATAEYYKGTQLNPDLSTGQEKLADVLNKQNLFSEALNVYKKAIEIQPHFQTYIKAGVLLLKQGKPEEAVTEFENSIQLNPNHFWSHHYLGNSLRDLGKLDEAISCYRCSIKLNPNFFGSHLNLGDVLEKQEKLEEAITEYRAAIKIQPNFLNSSNKLINVLEKQNQLNKEFVIEYRKFVDEQPTSPQAHYNLGKILQKLDSFDEAAVEYQYAIQLNSNFKEAHLSLAQVLEQQGKIDIAIDRYRKAIQIAPYPQDSYIQSQEVSQLTTELLVNTEANDREIVVNYSIQNSKKNKVKRLAVVLTVFMLINVIARFRFQEAQGEFKDCECEDFLLIVTDTVDRAKPILQVASQIWNFKKIFSTFGVVRLWQENWSSLSTTVEVLKQEINLDRVDVLYTMGDWTGIDLLALAAYPHARIIFFGDGLGYLVLSSVDHQNDAYLITPYEWVNNSFNTNKVTTVSPDFLKSVIDDSAKYIEGLEECCQEIKQNLGEGFTVYLTGHFSQTEHFEGYHKEVEMYVSYALSYTKPGEAILVKGHPAAKKQAYLTAEKLQQHDRKAIVVKDKFNLIPIELFVPFLKFGKAITFLSSSSISLAYLCQCDIIMGLSNEQFNEYFNPSTCHRLRMTIEAMYLQVLQAFRKKFEPIRHSDSQELAKLPSKFPILISPQDIDPHSS